MEWGDLDPRTRKLVIAVAAAEGALKIAALVDLVRRPKAEIRGSKWAWAPAILVVNSLGALPAAYFLLGRKRG